MKNSNGWAGLYKEWLKLQGYWPDHIPAPANKKKKKVKT